MKKLKLLLLLPTLALVGCGKKGGDKPTDKWKAIDAAEMKSFITDFYGKLNVGFSLNEEGRIDIDVTDDGEAFTNSLIKGTPGYYGTSYEGYREASAEKDTSFYIGTEGFGYDIEAKVQYGYNSYEDEEDNESRKYWYVIEDDKEFDYYQEDDGEVEKKLYNDEPNAVERFDEDGKNGLGEGFYYFSCVGLETIGAVALDVSDPSKFSAHLSNFDTVGIIAEYSPYIEGGVNFKYDFFKSNDGFYKIVETLNKTEVTISGEEPVLSGTAKVTYTHEVIFGKFALDSEKYDCVISYDMHINEKDYKEIYTDKLTLEFTDNYKLEPVPTVTVINVELPD